MILTNHAEITFCGTYYVFCYNAYLFQFQVVGVHKLPTDQDQDALIERYAAKLKQQKTLKIITWIIPIRNKLNNLNKGIKKRFLPFP